MERLCACAGVRGMFVGGFVVLLCADDGEATRQDVQPSQVDARSRLPLLGGMPSRHTQARVWVRDPRRGRRRDNAGHRYFLRPTSRARPRGARADSVVPRFSRLAKTAETKGGRTRRVSWRERGNESGRTLRAGKRRRVRSRAAEETQLLAPVSRRAEYVLRFVLVL